MINYLMNVKQLMEWNLAEKIEILGEISPQYQFVHHKFRMTCTGIQTVPQRWEADD
jgi:hypothetical protein